MHNRDLWHCVCSMSLRLLKRVHCVLRTGLMVTTARVGPWLAGGVMFSTCLLVRPSIRPSWPFVCYQVTNMWTLTNEPISMQLGINIPPRQRHERSTSGVRRSKVKVTGGRSYILKHDGDIILDLLSRIDRDMQWATEMWPVHIIIIIFYLPWK